MAGREHERELAGRGPSRHKVKGIKRKRSWIGANGSSSQELKLKGALKKEQNLDRSKRRKRTV